MAAPVLIPCLVQLRTEFDEAYPGRGRASDGWIGDTAHQQETSDHNDDEVGNVPIHDGDHVHEVHAVDVDNNLDGKGPVSGARMGLMEARVQFLLARCRSGAETRLRYIIYNRRIWKASNGWRQESYKGPSAHTEHAHFSASYDTVLEALTASWGITSEGLVDDMPLTAGDHTAIVYDAKQAIAAYVDDIGNYAPTVARFAQLSTKLDALLIAAGKEAAEVPATPEQIADAVLLKLGPVGGRTPDQTAELLITALGVDAAAVADAMRVRIGA